MFDVEIRKGGMFDKDITLRAKTVDTTNPFFIVISGIERELRSTSLALPDDENFEKFSKYSTIQLPQHQVGFIGELKPEIFKPKLAVVDEKNLDS